MNDDSQLGNARRWQMRAEAEKDALAANVQDAYETLGQINGVNLDQSLAGAIFDLTQRIRRLREALDLVVRCAIQGETDECLICRCPEVEEEYRHTDDCPILAAEKVLNETTLGYDSGGATKG